MLKLIDVSPKVSDVRRESMTHEEYPRVLQEAIALVLRAPSLLQTPLAKALKMSLDMQVDDATDSHSAHSIESELGVDVQTQVRNRVSLKRDNVLSLLHDLGKTDYTLAKLGSVVTEETYKYTFDNRELARLGNAHVFTYSEVLFIVGPQIQIPLPDDVEEIVRNGRS